MANIWIFNKLNTKRIIANKILNRFELFGANDLKWHKYKLHDMSWPSNFFWLCGKQTNKQTNKIKENQKQYKLHEMSWRSNFLALVGPSVRVEQVWANLLKRFIIFQFNLIDLSYKLPKQLPSYGRCKCAA